MSYEPMDDGIEASLRSEDETENSEEEELGEEEYFVERILRRKYDKTMKSELFLVKWRDYGEKDNTWEPMENLKVQVLSSFEEEC